MSCPSYLAGRSSHKVSEHQQSAIADSVNITLVPMQTDGIGINRRGPPITVTLPAKGHVAKFIGQLVSIWSAGSVGVVEISVPSEIATLTMRSLVNQRGEFLLATFPVADLTKTAAKPIVFPQIADGGGYKTEVILISPGSTTVWSAIRFIDSSGQPQ